MASTVAVEGGGLPRVLVLGGIGHVGRTLVKFLLDNDLVSYIRVADKAIPIIAYCSAEHEQCFKDPRVQFLQADLTKKQHLEKVFAFQEGEEGFDFIVNAAAETRNGLAEDVYKSRVFDLSVQCAKYAMGSSKVSRLKKFIELSTGQVYSSQVRAPAKENGATKPWTLHAKYKLMAEVALQEMEGLPLVVLRLATVYGKADSRGVMPRVVTAAAYQALGETMSFLWGKDLKINTVHVEDVVQGIWHVCTAKDGVPNNSIFNLVDKGDTTQGTMSAILGKLFGIKTDFYGKLISNFARLNLASVVEEANDKHMQPWTELCSAHNIRSTPLDPYMDKELLSSNHLYMDGSAIEVATGFAYKHEQVTLELIKEQVQYAMAEKLFPVISMDGDDDLKVSGQSTKAKK